MNPAELADREAEQRLAVAPSYPGRSRGLVLDLQVHLTTLLYGGGTDPGLPDHITPFRASSIRGHLRFWWRATRGAAFNTWEEMRREESRIWGDTDVRSPVRVEVDCPPAMRPRRIPLSSIPADDPRRYALFPPYNEKGADLTKERLQTSGRFNLRIVVDPQHQDIAGDIESALWGWLNFGGIGARTRRGAGALYCKDFANWNPAHAAGNGATRAWPTMKGGAVLWGAKPLGWDECWRTLLAMYKRFRQDRGPNGRGPTSWPEPDEIRAVRLDHEQPGRQGFPRSALGMPIIFHFKDPGDPRDQTLRPPHSERLASPVILRPFAISEAQAYPMILILNTAPAEELLLKQGNKDSGIAVPRGMRDAIAELIARAAAPPLSASPVRI